MAKRKRKWGSPKQRAAFKKMIAARKGKSRKSAPSRPKARRRVKRRKVLASGRHRPVVIRKRGRIYRPRRSSIPSHAKFANPFLGGLTVMGNPRRRKSRKSHRKSHRRSNRGLRLYSNPGISSALSAPKEMISKDFITEAASVAAGFVLPNVVMSYLPTTFRDAPWKGYASKVAVVAVLSGAANMVSKRASKAILLGGGVSLLLDLYTDYLAPMIHGTAAAPAASAPASVAAFYGNAGDPGYLGAFYGNNGDPGSGLSDGGAIGEAFA